MGSFFFKEVERIEKSFISTLKRIPKSNEQKKVEGISNMFSKRIDRFGDFAILDQLVKTYTSYTHDDIFNLELVMVHNMILLNKELAYVQSATNETLKKMNEK